MGATVAGAAAVLVALVTNGVTDALLVLVAVVVVQQVEGNLLQPFIMGRGLRLHPLVILVAVSAATLLGGIPGAVVAVPVVAVCYRVASSLRSDADIGTPGGTDAHPAEDPADGHPAEDPAKADPAGDPADAHPAGKPADAHPAGERSP